MKVKILTSNNYAVLENDVNRFIKKQKCYRY